MRFRWIPDNRFLTPLPIMADSAAAILPVGAGYGKEMVCCRTSSADRLLGVVVGIGFFFAFLMMGISWMQNRYTEYSTKQSEEFNTASRSVKPGLIASGIVSAWTWAATLLQSSTVSEVLLDVIQKIDFVRLLTRTESPVLSGTRRERRSKSLCSPFWLARSSKMRRGAILT